MPSNDDDVNGLRNPYIQAYTVNEVSDTYKINTQAGDCFSLDVKEELLVNCIPGNCIAVKLTPVTKLLLVLLIHCPLQLLIPFH